MKTIKIIDLYTKLANKEIIPRYIKVCERKYEFDESDNEYYPRNENDTATLLERISRGNVWAWLNAEVQELDSLEEDKKIEPLEYEIECARMPEIDGKPYTEVYKFKIKDVVLKINELIDEVNKLKEER